MDGAFGGYANMTSLIDRALWRGVNEIDSFDAKANRTGVSIQRNVYRRDTNLPADFELSSRPTKGRENAYRSLIVIQEAAGLARRLHRTLVRTAGAAATASTSSYLSADSGRFANWRSVPRATSCS
jgi:hypothetical protein